MRQKNGVLERYNIHIYISICIYIYIYIWKVCIRLCVCVYIHDYINVYWCSYICIYTYIYLFIYYHTRLTKGWPAHQYNDLCKTLKFVKVKSMKRIIEVGSKVHMFCIICYIFPSHEHIFLIGFILHLCRSGWSVLVWRYIS
jgi:hypothetical protein